MPSDSRLRPLYRHGIPALALGQGLSEIGFVLAVRAGFRHGDSLPLLAAIVACVLLRFAFQDRGAALESRALRDVVSALRKRLLEALRARAVPAYRPDHRRALDRALEEHVPRAAEGLLAHRHFKGALLQCALFIGILILFSWKTALIGLAFAAMVWPVLRWRNHSLKNLESEGAAGRGAAQRARANLGASLESLPGKGLEEALHRFETELARTHRPEWRWRAAQGRYPALLETGLFFVLAAILLAGSFTLPDWGSFLVFSLLLLLAYRPVREAARHWPASLAGKRAMHDVERLAREWEALPPRKVPEAHPDGNAFTLRRVNFAYEPGMTVLDDFSAELPAGRITGVTGPNGAGKTTLLRLLSCAEIPLRGQILWPNTARARGISYLPQRVHPGTDWAEWAESLRTGRPDLWVELDALLQLERLKEKSAHPEALSGGERQRMALARALASDAAFLLLDEPTTALPGDTREGILRGALELWTRDRGEDAGNPRRGAVVVSHEPFLGRLCDAVFAMDPETAGTKGSKGSALDFKGGGKTA